MSAIEAKTYGLVDEVLGDISDIVVVENGEIKVPELNGDGSHR